LNNISYLCAIFFTLPAILPARELVELSRHLFASLLRRHPTCTALSGVALCLPKNLANPLARHVELFANGFIAQTGGLESADLVTSFDVAASGSGAGLP
jgi:hypothetical protein